MPIYPLPQFEADLALERTEREAYERLNTPKTVVVRFGVMKMIGEFPFGLSVKPGCGTKMVARTHRGTELAEMLTSTCPNAGCSKSVTRKEMLEYIENSGGKDYPYFNDGSILRIATTDDLNEQRRIDGLRPAMKRFAQAEADGLGLKMKIVDTEPILGAERLTFYFTSEDRVDFRDLVQTLSREYPARIELRQVGARDEARLIADYEKCGQHCCCKQFLKVLKPISMKSAKIQKATLDPLKISGRCGRLMCCLRYEDETYDTLRKRLPKMKSRVGTPEGPGTVIDAQILTQLVLVELDADGKRVAIPVESLTNDAPPAPPVPVRPAEGAGARGPRPTPGAGSGTGSRGPTGGAPSSRRPEPGRDAEGGRDAEAERAGGDEDPLRGISAEEVERRLGGAAEPGADRPTERSGGPGPRQRSFQDRDRSRERGPDRERDRDRPRPEGDPRRPQDRREGGPRPPSDRSTDDRARGDRPPREARTGPQSGGSPAGGAGGGGGEGRGGEGRGGEGRVVEGREGAGGKRRKRRRRGGRGGQGGGPGGAGGPPQAGPPAGGG